MYFSEAHKAAVYTVQDPARYENAVPGAKRLNGHMLAVPVNFTSMRACQHLNLPTVNPMQVEYDWPGRFTPFAHQRVMSGFMALNPRCFNLSDMGTGKTLSCLWAADYLMRLGRGKKCLIICTLSTMNAAWGDEIFTHLMGKRTFTLVLGSAERRLERLGDDVDFYIINHDGIKVRGVAEALAARKDIDLVIVDEVSAFKHSGSQRYRALRSLVSSRLYVWLLTGTPAANSPTDAWGVARLIGATTLSFAAFRDRTMTKAGAFRWLPRPQAAQEVATILRPAIRYKREDCLDLPECITETRQVSLSPKQKAAYANMKRQLAITVANGETISAVNDAVLRLKLIQISCGAIYNADHEVHQIDCAPKLDELKHVMASISAKIIIFAPLTSVVKMLYRELSGIYSVAMITGEVPQATRTEVFRGFQMSDRPWVIVADPRTMAHGLTLTRADTIIWFGPIDSLEVYLQANARMNRPGQKNRMLVVHLASTAVEREIYRRLSEKETLQGAILKLVEG